MEEIDGKGQAGPWNGGAGTAWVDEQDVIDAMFRSVEEALLASCPAHEAAGILDVGCGTGGTTLALARRVKAGVRCLGVDISAQMVAAARRRAADEGLAADFVQADAQRHAFAPASVDLVVSRFGVMFFDDPVAAFANLRRAMRPNGQLRFMAWRGPGDNPFMTAAEEAARPLLPDLPRRTPDEPGQFGFARAARVLAILEEAGWEAPRCEPVDIVCRFPAAALDGYLARMGLVGRALEGADPALRQAVLARVRPRFERYVEGGVVRFTAACWLAGAGAGASLKPPGYESSPSRASGSPRS